jgi:hypothetical protein
LNTLAEAKWFSTLNLQSGFWQAALRPEDKETAAFSTGQGQRQFTVMPFGISNATFQPVMEIISIGLTFDSCLLHLDNVIVIGHTFHEQPHNLQKVFHRFREVHLKLNPERCQ